MNPYDSNVGGAKSDSSVPVYPTTPPPVYPLPQKQVPYTDVPDSPIFALVDEEINSSRWIWMTAGFFMGSVFGLLALIPLCFISELRTSPINRNAYLLGYVPGMIFATVSYTMLFLFLSAIAKASASS